MSALIVMMERLLQRASARNEILGVEARASDLRRRDSPCLQHWAECRIE